MSYIGFVRPITILIPMKMIRINFLAKKKHTTITHNHDAMNSNEYYLTSPYVMVILMDKFSLKICANLVMTNCKIMIKCPFTNFQTA